jgi:hypothetical protein
LSLTRAAPAQACLLGRSATASLAGLRRAAAARRCGQRARHGAPQRTIRAFPDMHLGALRADMHLGAQCAAQVHVASAEVPMLPALPSPVAHLLCNRQALREVFYGLAKVPLRLIHIPEVPVRPALPCPFAHHLCNCQVLRDLRVVVDGLAKVPLRPILIPEVRVRLAPAWSPTSFAIARCFVWYSMALE